MFLEPFTNTLNGLIFVKMIILPYGFLDLLSANFSQEEIGDPILDTELEAGDVLYFPRGTIHQVCRVLVMII